MTTITIPGTAYDECFDPRASDMAKDIGLPIPSKRRRGKGLQVIYANITVEQAREVGEHLVSMGGLWISNSEPEERGRYRTLIKAGERILRELG